MSNQTPQTIDRGNAVPFAAFVPHPPILLPEIGGADSAQVRSTFDACEGIALELARRNCGTVVMTSPHMAGIGRTPGVFSSPSFKGDLSQFRAPQLKFEFDNDNALADLLCERIPAAGVPFRRIESGPPEGGLKLDHGLTVFLYFLERIGYKPRICLITPAYSAYQDNFHYGNLIALAMAEHSESCAFVASGDLSHRLTRDAPAGFDPRGREFDETYCRAVKERDYSAVLNMDAGLIDAAGVCGHVTMLMLLGSSLTLGLESSFVSYEGPWGVGYLVSRFEQGDAD